MHSTGSREPPPTSALSTVVGMASLSLMTWGGRFIGMGREHWPRDGQVSPRPVRAAICRALPIVVRATVGQDSVPMNQFRSVGAPSRRECLPP